MILTVNLGNTHITIGGYEHDDLKFCGRLHTDPAATVDEYGLRLLNLLSLHGASPEQIEGGILGSVVPAWEQKEHKPVLHIHATGQYGVELFRDLEKEKGFAPGESLVVKEYINNMPELLAAADLVISRAGALTLAELEAEGRAAILIPSPNVAENHQYYNAMELQKAGAAVVIEEKDLTGEKLVSTVSGLLAEPGKLAAMGRNARTLSVDDSLDRIADALMKLVKTP